MTTPQQIILTFWLVALVAVAGKDENSTRPTHTVANGCRLVLAKSGGYYVVPDSKYPRPVEIVVDLPPTTALVVPALPPWRDTNPSLARQEFLEWIEKSAGREPEIVTYLTQHPPLWECFESAQGEVRAHTSVVLANAAMQWELFDLESVHVPPGFALKALLKATLALHDVGKGSHAYLNDITMSQHQATVPILQRTLATMGFTDAEIAVAVALVNHDHIGLMMRERQSLEESYRALVALAGTTVLTPRDFFRLQEFYYLVDVAAYPSLRKKVFGLSSWSQWTEPENHRLTPVNPLFQQLRDRFQ